MRLPHVTGFRMPGRVESARAGLARWASLLWSPQAETLKEFDDVREIQRRLRAYGLFLTSEADESTTGPASLTLLDPDGNLILVDQHVDSPRNLKEKIPCIKN